VVGERAIGGHFPKSSMRLGGAKAWAACER
jgi:hypothetical protein